MTITGCGVEQPALYSEEQSEPPDTVTPPAVVVSETTEEPETTDAIEKPSDSTAPAQSGETMTFEYADLVV